MMHECVKDVLYFGDQDSCTPSNAQNFALVHACKDPCHRRAVGYSQRSLNADHPMYLAREQENQLFLNLIDPPVPLFQIESFKIFLDFADRARARGLPLLIHCNQGQSRAPSFALLTMAKRLGALPNDSYAAAAEAFAQNHPYTPGKGIATFLTQHWTELE